MGTPNEGINGTLATGLLGHWDFTDGRLLDSSGNSNDLSLYGSIIPTTADKDGNVNNALNFDSTSGLRRLSGVATSNGYTISMWIKTTAGGSLLISRLLYPTVAQFDFYLVNGKPQLYYFNVSGTVLNSTTTINDGNWYNIVITINSAGAQLYINKKYDCEMIRAISLGGFSQLYFGRYDASSLVYTGYFDESRLYNRVLTGKPAQIGDDTTGEIAELFEMGVNYEIIRPSPSVNVDSGTYIGSITIEMSSEDESEIYYTLNGSDPDETDLLYENPITISRSVVLKAVAIKNGTLSEIVTKIYYIEGGDIGMEENQSAGLIVIGWTPEGETKETILGEVPADGQEVLSIQETINYFKTKYAGEYPTEGRVVAGAATFTVDLIESPTLRSLLSNTSAVSGTKTIIGVNSGAKAKTGKLRLHPMYAGADKSEDITILRAAPAVTDERTYSADGKKLMKVVFTVMGVKTALETPSVSAFAAHMNSSVIKVKMVNANDLGVSIASAAEGVINDASNIVNFTVGIGANRAIFFKSLDDFATAGNTSYYEPTADEIKAGSFAPETVTWKPLTALTEIPTEATGYYYKAIEIGV